MPKINIYETDNTGSASYDDSVGILVLGTASVKDSELLDANGCVTIEYDASISDYFDDSAFEEASADDDGFRTVALISQYMSWGYDVVYCNITNVTDLSFLQDKDTYEIKFLTAGALGSIKRSADGVYADQYTTMLVKQAESRKDCVVLADCNYSEDTELATLEGDALAKELYSWLNISSGLGTSYAALFFPNGSASLEALGTTALCTVPGYYAYLYAFAQFMRSTYTWSPMAGITRGGVGSFSSNLSVTKYNFDQNIILDQNISFNGIVPTRNYGTIIWGDRTLYNNTSSVKATSYLSLRNLVSDIAKRAYQTSIMYTYESNNDITWVNFRTQIVDLLDQMVSSGVLSFYDIKKIKKSTTPANKLICQITIYPNLPLENFDIYINLENAEVSTSEEE